MDKMAFLNKMKTHVPLGVAEELKYYAEMDEKASSSWGGCCCSPNCWYLPHCYMYR